MKVFHARKKCSKIKDLSFLKKYILLTFHLCRKDNFKPIMDLTCTKMKKMWKYVYKFDMFTGPYLHLLEGQTCL